MLTRYERSTRNTSLNPLVRLDDSPVGVSSVSCVKAWSDIERRQKCQQYRHARVGA